MLVLWTSEALGFFLYYNHAALTCLRRGFGRQAALEKQTDIMSPSIFFQARRAGKVVAQDATGRY
jgi:hypothetical protein